MKTRWIITLTAVCALGFGALAWAGSRSSDANDDDGAQDPSWTAPSHPGGNGGFGFGRMGRRFGMMARRQELLKDLDLSHDQMKEIMDIRDQQQRRAVDQRAKIQVAALDLRKMMRASRPDRDDIEHQIDVIARLRAELRKSQVDALLDMREVLTPEQREKVRDRWLGVGGSD